MNEDLAAFVSGVEIGASGGASGQGYRNVQGQLRRIMAGIPSQSVAAGASADLTSTVSEPFKIERLILSVAAQAMNVTNIKIGMKSLNVSGSPVSGNCFSEQAIGSQLNGYTAQPGVGFIVSVTNPTGAAVLSGGDAFGPALTP